MVYLLCKARALTQCTALLTHLPPHLTPQPLSPSSPPVNASSSSPSVEPCVPPTPVSDEISERDRGVRLRLPR